MKKSITNGKLRIILDEDHLKNTKDRLLEEWDEEDLECEIPLDQRTYEGEINRLYQLAKDIMTSAEIFDYLPTTKSGYFHKTKNILVADSKIRFWNEYVTVGIDLKLRQKPYNECSIYETPKGNGLELYLEMDWYNVKPSEQSIYDHSGHIHKIDSPSKAKYFPLQELKPGYLYATKNGQSYLYLGVRKIYAIPKISLMPEETLYATFDWDTKSYVDLQTGQMCVLKYTKIREQQLAKCKTISDVFHILSDVEDRKGRIKRTVEMKMSLNFEKCLGKFVEDDQKDQVIPYTISDPYKIFNTKTGKEEVKTDPIKLDQHIDYHQDPSDFIQNQKGDLQIFLSSKLLKRCHEYYLNQYHCTLDPEKDWGISESQWAEEWKGLEEKIQELIHDNCLIDQLPLKRNGTFPETICIWKSKLINKYEHIQYGVYLYAYSVREIMETFSGTSIPMVPKKMAYLCIDYGSITDSAIFYEK